MFDPGPPARPVRPPCRHCRRALVCRPRGLCWCCYYAPGVRDRYPVTSKYGRRGVGDFYRVAPLPDPTAALPGTPKKVAVLAARAAAGTALFHPKDATR